MARGKALQQSGDASRARGVLDAVVALAPTDPEIRAAHARRLAADGDDEGAVEHFDAAIALGAG